MIFLDTSETRSSSTMPDIPDATTVDNLEELTGADMMVSPFNAPAVSEPLIRVHLQNGAQLVQVKRGRDLVSSLGGRLSFSLAKMQSVGARQSQCVLLFIGIMTCDAEGQAIINKQATGQKFIDVQAAVEAWSDRGGVFFALPRASLIPEWCRMRSRRLKKYRDNPVRTAYPDTVSLTEYDERLQMVVPVTDARRTLITLPNLGEKKVNILWEEFSGVATDILIWLTCPEMENMRVKGIGQGTRDAIREYLGIDPIYTLGYDVSETLVERLMKEKKDD